MPEPFTLYQLPPSPNNIKVRLALGLKELPYRTVDILPDGDRSQIVEVSGQPLTPVLVDGDRVVFDSGAILRYLHANYPDSPPLFAGDYETMKEIEGWERRGRTELLEPFGVALVQVLGDGDPDLAEMERASKMLHERSAVLEERLGRGDWLVGDHPTAADLTCAVTAWYGMLPESVVETFPPARLLVDHLHLGDDRDATRAWVKRVMSWDRPPQS